MTDRASRWRHLVALPLAVIALLPLAVMLGGSLRQVGLPPPRTLELLPWPLAWENYRQAGDLVNLGRLTLNSLTVALLAVPLSVLVASWAGFAISRLPRRAARVLLGVSLVALMIPLTALLVGRFSIFATVGLIDTYAPLVAPALIGTSPLYVLVYYWAFRRLPQELFEAARLEGLSPYAAWRQVAMPLVRPVTLAVATLAFGISWGNFLEPLIYIFNPDLYTVPLGLRSLAQLDPTRSPLLLAGAVIGTIPAAAAFLIAQRAVLR
ncbi:MAG TPA: carbohydrate ABC transporter permease, partial [Candidatus Limnocylindrales bacterium]|nr:carbohydrate ABC transporter permease [Candidatus Limnocylindrales bacterium]